MRLSKLFSLIFIFCFVFFVYFAVGTQFTFRPKWALDYFNPLAQALLHGRLDIERPVITYDLIQYQGKWYTPWGVLVALPLMPLQIIMGRFVPLIYFSVFSASLNVVLIYLLLVRIKQEFFPAMSGLATYCFLTLFAFGTVHFYVGTLGSSWHVDQMASSLLGILGVYVIFKKKRAAKDYILSTVCFALTLLGRATTVFLVTLPVLLYIHDKFLVDTYKQKNFFVQIQKMCMIFGTPLVLGSAWFLFYNAARFGNPLSSGYQYIHEAPYLANIRQQNGLMSIKNIPNNLWFMTMEIPALTLRDKISLDFNLKGNSIFFLTPPLLAIFLANPFVKKKSSVAVDPYVMSLWSTTVLTLIPILLFYSTGWMQFGYRYSLTVVHLFLLLCVFGTKGKITMLYFVGILCSIVLYMMGIMALW